MVKRQSRSSRETDAPVIRYGRSRQRVAGRHRPACPTDSQRAEMELSLAQRQNSQYANKELKGRTPGNLGLSRVEGVGRDLLKSDTLGGRNLASTESVGEIR